MYGLDPLDYEVIDEKLDFQKSFIENPIFYLSLQNLKDLNRTY